MKKQEIIGELKEIARKLGKSPARREVPNRINHQCIRLFGSFNNAKEKAGLTITHKRSKPLTENAKNLDIILVRIVAYLTFDGHLNGKLKECQFASNSQKVIEGIKEDIYKKFNIRPSKIEMGNGYGKNVLKCRYFNKNLCKFLYSTGVPKGDKVVTKFNIPMWIKNDKNFAKEYLKIAFLCEGCKSKKSKNTEEIQINLHKAEELLQDGLKYMKSLQRLLKKFDIDSTKIWLIQGNKRKRDGKTTKGMRFKIKANSFNNFINQIGWYK